MNDVSLHGIDIHTYFVKDAERAIAFWRDKMGLHPTWLDAGGRGAEFELPDGSTFGLWKLDPEEGGWMQGSGVAFSVPDIQNAISAYRERGIDVSDADETPVCFMAFAKDTEDNSFILHQRKA